MALDFPNSPTLGQLFTSGALSWRWDGAKWVAASTLTGLYFPNKLVNPFMEIDQANEGTSLTVSGNYILDGVVCNSAVAGTYSAQRVTDAPPGFSNSVRITNTATASLVANSIVQIRKDIEADDMIDTAFGTSSAQTLSVAFWAKSSLAGTYGACLQNAVQNRSFAWNFTLTAANTWQFFTQIVPGDVTGTWTLSGNGKSLIFFVNPVVGTTFQGTTGTWAAGALGGGAGQTNTILSTTGATFQLGPCGLWVAPAPQPLLRTSIEAELARCQRYYEKSYDIGTAVGATSGGGGSSEYIVGSGTINNRGWAVPFKTTKRAVPSITCYSPTTGASGKIRDNQGAADITANVNMTSAGNFGVYGTTAATAINMGMHWTADARL